MRFVVPAALAALLTVAGAAAPAFSQSINIGPGGVSVDPRSPQERAVDRQIQRQERWRERERWEHRRAMREERRYGRRDCRTVTEQQETRRGLVTRTTRVCD